MSTAAISSYESLGLAGTNQRVKKSEIGQDDFLQLMTKQLQAQDPFKPMDSSQFLGQIAQFSQVSGLQQLNTAFSGLAASLTDNQVLQGASLVGREVLASGSKLSLDGDDAASGAILVPESGWLSLEIVDGAGQTVRRIDYGQQTAGITDFDWDGLGADGQHVAAGSYQLRANVATAAHGTVAANTYVAGTVRGVTPTSSGLQLDVEGLGALALSQVARIQ